LEDGRRDKMTDAAWFTQSSEGDAEIAELDIARPDNTGPYSKGGDLET